MNFKADQEIFEKRSLKRPQVSLLNAVVNGFLLFLAAVVILIEQAECAQRTFYSIQIATLTNLQHTKIHVNSLKKKRKTVFWKKINIPGKGEFYRVYLGKFKDRSDALKVWKKLIIEGSVDYCEIHRFVESDVRKEETKARQTKVLPVDEELFRTIRQPEAGNRFVDNQDGTVTDTKTNLMWVKNGRRFEFFSAETWWNAKKQCEKFRLKNYTNWRLPGISEWVLLIDKNHQSPALAEPNPFRNIVFRLPYWSGTEFVAKLDHALTPVHPVRAYTVMLYSGKISHQQKGERAFVLPVRTIK